MKKLGKAYDEAKAYTDFEKLAPGGYVLKVQAVKYENGQNGNSDVIVLRFDIEEGEQKEFFSRNYESQTQEDKKWKGTYRLYVPKEDGSEQDGWTIKRFKTVMNNFEDSNNGYHWNWDENTLKGKIIGGIFNEKEYEFNGRNGFFTNCYSLVAASKIREGNFKVPDATLLKNRKGRQATESDFQPIPEGTDEEIPF